jgi:hypothetical protein
VERYLVKDLTDCEAHRSKYHVSPHDGGRMLVQGEYKTVSEHKCRSVCFLKPHWQTCFRSWIATQNPRKISAVGTVFAMIKNPLLSFLKAMYPSLSASVFASCNRKLTLVKVSAIFQLPLRTRMFRTTVMINNPTAATRMPQTTKIPHHMIVLPPS